MDRRRQPQLNTSLLVLCVASLALRGDGGCDSSIVGDPTFDLWCADTLCSWDVEAGEVRRVSTWHRSDYGVELLGDPVVLSQQVASVSGCLEVRLQADHADDVDLVLEIDIYADQQANHVEPVVSDNYRQVTFYVQAPSWSSKARFAVRKTGEGRAVLAEVKIKSVDEDECIGAAEIELDERRDGTPCQRDQDCSSGHCSNVRQWRADVEWSDDYASEGEVSVCGACSRDDDCSDGQICGLSRSPETWQYVHRRCVAAGEAAVGQRCAIDAECSSAVCCGGVCSGCCPDTYGQQCATGTCEVLDTTALGDDFRLQITPALCASAAPGKSGDLCFVDDDCESGSCSEAQMIGTCFLDGRSCNNALGVTGCTYWPFACLELNAGGRCD